MQIIHMLLLDHLMSIMYRLALVLSIMHLIMRKGRCKAIFMLQILMILAMYNTVDNEFACWYRAYLNLNTLLL